MRIERNINMKIENAKSKFEHPTVKIVQLEVKDIITISGGGNNAEDPGIDLPIDPLI